VITGYNTDVKHNNRVFHIQTEDKGDSSPHIESLVYVGGQILATRKTSYAELIGSGRDDKAVQELMEQQHRTMIAAIQRGRFDGPNGGLQSPEGEDEADRSPSPGSARERATSGDRTLDQVILDYLASELAHDQIDCSFSPIPEFTGGKTASVRIRAASSMSKQPVANAAIQVRILSTIARPTVVFDGKTAADGTCAASFMVPAYREGSAAAVIRVTSPIGSTEFKFPVKRSA
jgi:hypothetical protein